MFISDGLSKSAKARTYISSKDKNLFLTARMLGIEEEEEKGGHGEGAAEEQKALRKVPACPFTPCFLSRATDPEHFWHGSGFGIFYRHGSF